MKLTTMKQRKPFCSTTGLSLGLSRPGDGVPGPRREP
jgi:hypothetical protein